MRTRVTNPTSVAKHYGYLPAHGVKLAAGASVVLDGDLRTVLASGRGRYSRSHELKALYYDETNDRIVVEKVTEPSSSSSGA